MNVLLILADQHRADCLGCVPPGLAVTPHLDRLASEGMRFTAAYAQSPICTPSRVSILSGQYCHNHGYYTLCGPVPQRLPSFLSHFRRHRFFTGAIGKLHVPDNPVNWLADHVDYWSEIWHWSELHHYGPVGQPDVASYRDWLAARGKQEDPHLNERIAREQIRFDGAVQELDYEDSMEAFVAAKTGEFLAKARAAGRPFCAEVSFNRPHTQPDVLSTATRQFWELFPPDLAMPRGWDADPSGRPPHFQYFHERWKTSPALVQSSDAERLRRIWRGYLAGIAQTDHAIGEVLTHLEQAGLAENTIVIYSSDHGAYAGAFGLPEKAPGICSDLVCRVPMIWRIPGVAAAGTVCEELVELVDIAPTITALCGLPAMQSVDGCDLSTLLRGSFTPLRSLAVTENYWSRSVRWGPWRWVHYQPEMFGGADDVGELYNLEKDPFEAHNLYKTAEGGQVVQEMRRLLLEWLIRTRRCVTAPLGVEGLEQLPEDGGDGSMANRHRSGEKIMNYL